MCGISGIVDFSQTVARSEIVSLMTKAQTHRGQDHKNVISDNYSSLGHNRLSIIDISDKGNQPMFSTDKRFVIFYNGEVYNYLELKEKIKNKNLKSKTDTEVVLNLFAEKGTKSIELLDGMFAFAIWDKERKKLFLARDKMGIKPLYYCIKDKTLIFASEIKTILKSGLINNELNKSELCKYAVFQTNQAPNTIFSEIKMAEVGHYIIFSEKGIEKKCYYKPKYQETCLPRNEIYRKIRKLTFESIEKRLMSDVPFGIFLSGGIDSGLITAIASSIYSEKIRTFTISFEEKKYDESEFASLTAKRFKSKHTNIKLNASKMLEEIPQALSAMDYPSGDGMNTYFISKAVRKEGIKMAISGLGSDELFGGYPFFRQMYRLNSLKQFSKIPFMLKKMIALIAETFLASKGKKISEIIKQKNWNIEQIYPYIRKLPIPEIINNQNTELDLSRNNDIDNFPFLSKISVMELYFYLQNILLRDADQMRMASSLEVRVPFMDTKLWDFVLNIPDKIKYPNSPKQLLTNAFSDFIPNETIRRGKMGFVLPLNKWLRNELKNFGQEQLAVLCDFRTFNSDKITELWNNFLKNKRAVNYSYLWHLIVLGYQINKNNLS